LYFNIRSAEALKEALKGQILYFNIRAMLKYKI